MSWTNFLIATFVVYLLYYVLNLLADIFFSPRVQEGEIAEDELFFSKTFTPELITVEEKVKGQDAVAEAVETKKPNSSISTGSVTSSGGIGLKQLFSLAKDNLIEHTRAIPY